MFQKEKRKTKTKTKRKEKGSQANEVLINVGYVIMLMLLQSTIENKIS